MRYSITIILVLLFSTSCNQVAPNFTNSLDAQTSTPTSTLAIIASADAIPQVMPTSSPIPISTKATQAASNLSSEKLLRFSGKVSRGQIFEYKVSQTLVFRLEPRQSGWDIWIGEETEPLNDYVAVVTPPYYGMNARHIEGWHFRNSDNSGPNEPGPKLVDAPQKERRFYFILSKTDYWIAYNGLNARSLSSAEERKQAEERRKQLEPRKGVLTITDLKLGNLEIGERAWIEYMEFEVELNLPPGFE